MALNGLEKIILVLVTAGILYYMMCNSVMLKDRFYGDRSNIYGPYMLTKDTANCGDNLGKFYYDKYRDKHYYQPHSYDAKNYYDLMRQQGVVTHEKVWNARMGSAMDKSYTDNQGNAYAKVDDAGLTTNSEVNNKISFNQIDKSNTHNAVLDANKVNAANAANAVNQVRNAANARNAPNAPNANGNAVVGGGAEGMANSEQLNVNDLLPDPCLNKGKDWTNVFSECENLVGGQNFVHFEDEHFVNQVLDTRCTKYMSLDFRKPPAIQYTDVSIWNKPSVCKNIYEYVRPSLDGE